MTSRPFMQELSQLRRTYVHTPRDVNEELLEKIAIHFGDLANQVLHPPVTPMIATFSLRSIARLCLDAMQAGDHYEAVFNDVADLHARKNAGYAGVGTQDPWANFRMSEPFGVSAFVGCLIRMSDKFIRIRNLAENPAADQVGEAMKDTLFDLAIYSLIAICLCREEDQIRKEQEFLASETTDAMIKSRE